MEQVTLAEAKEHLDDLLQRAARGADVRIADPSFGTVKLQPVTAAPADAPKPKRVPRSLKGILTEPPEGFFDLMTEEELTDRYGTIREGSSRHACLRVVDFG
jgi:antitoxin (DNA-binding transcriptional repressor) of toxin-antitoxin stability system